MFKHLCLCQSAALPAWMLLVHHFRVGVEVSFGRLAGRCVSAFCSLRGRSLFSVCQLLLHGRARPLNHPGLACKLSVILSHERGSLNAKQHCLHLLKRPVGLISCWTSVALSVALFLSPSSSPLSASCLRALGLLSAPKHRLSGYSVGGNVGLQHVAQMDALRSCSGEGSCHGDPLPGGCFFFFSWVAVGSQRQLHEQ